ncbi:MAG TPA: helix-turn-helix domain-containing protein [Bordetella sp.]
MSKDKSTSGGAQRQRILQALALRPHNSYELRKMGCYQCPTRVIELRRQGYNIATERVTLWDDQGYRHSNVALYVLTGPGGAVMARARTLKPGLFKNETLAECSPLARLLFAGL